MRIYSQFSSLWGPSVVAGPGYVSLGTQTILYASFWVRGVSRSVYGRSFHPVII